MREQIAAAFTDESGGWSLACEIQREEWLSFVEAAAPPERGRERKKRILLSPTGFSLRGFLLPELSL